KAGPLRWRGAGGLSAQGGGREGGPDRRYRGLPFRSGGRRRRIAYRCPSCEHALRKVLSIPRRRLPPARWRDAGAASGIGAALGGDDPTARSSRAVIRCTVPGLCPDVSLLRLSRWHLAVRTGLLVDTRVAQAA